MQIICSRVQRVNACGIFRRDSSGLLFTLILHKQYPEARAKRCDISHRNCRYVLMCLLQLLISLASGNWIPLRYGRKINMRNNQPNWVTFDKDNRRKLNFKIIFVYFGVHIRAHVKLIAFQVASSWSMMLRTCWNTNSVISKALQFEQLDGGISRAIDIGTTLNKNTECMCTMTKLKRIRDVVDNRFNSSLFGWPGKKAGLPFE